MSSGDTPVRPLVPFRDIPVGPIIEPRKVGETWREFLVRRDQQQCEQYVRRRLLRELDRIFEADTENCLRAPEKRDPLEPPPQKRQRVPPSNCINCATG
jgi:hypothetical protein